MILKNIAYIYNNIINMGALCLKLILNTMRKTHTCMEAFSNSRSINQVARTYSTHNVLIQSSQLNPTLHLLPAIVPLTTVEK